MEGMDTTHHRRPYISKGSREGLSFNAYFLAFCFKNKQTYDINAGQTNGTESLLKCW